MLLIYQGICAALAILIAAVMLSPGEQGGGAAGQRRGLQITGAIVVVPLLLRLFLVK